MKGSFFLAWKYIAFYRLKSIILIICLSLTVVTPIIVYFTTNAYQEHLQERAQNLPLVLGAKGNQYDLMLRSLYFNGDPPDAIHMDVYEELKNKDVGHVIPMHVFFTAHKLSSSDEFHYENTPIIGTYMDYFYINKYKMLKGRLPVILGEVVVGFSVARRMNIKIGDFILSDQKNLYDISASYPLKMKVVGILHKTYTPDDNVFFVDLKTTWIIQGFIHGHDDVVKESEEKTVHVAPGKIYEYPEITEKNAHLFHSHENTNNLPITSIIVIPKNHRSKTLLLGDYLQSEKVQLIVTKDVVDQLMATIFHIQKFLNAYFFITACIVFLFMSLIITLSIRLRQQEFTTLTKMGCSNNMIFTMIFMEILLISFVSTIISSLLTYVFFYFLSPIQLLHLFIAN